MKYYKFETTQKKVCVMETAEKLISGPAQLASFCREACHLDEQMQEHFVVIMLNAKSRIVGYETVSIGSLTASICHPREVFRPAIVAGAYAVAVAHNHPSGDPTPSAEDIQTTKILVEAGKLLGMQVLDHIVIGDTTYYSFKENGLI